MIEGLSLFLDNGREIRSDVIPTMLKKIGKKEAGAWFIFFLLTLSGVALCYDPWRDAPDEIIAWIEVQDLFIFKSSSILLLYDGEQDGGESKADVKMIDFAHSHPQGWYHLPCILFRTDYFVFL
jgi:hypothetical protein